MNDLEDEYLEWRQLLDECILTPSTQKRHAELTRRLIESLGQDKDATAAEIEAEFELRLLDDLQQHAWDGFDPTRPTGKDC